MQSKIYLRQLVGLMILAFLFSFCKVNYEAIPYDFPKPVDTTDKPIELQEKKVYSTSQGVYADNQFDGARLNNFIHLNQDTFQADIHPENTPINASAYYALRLWSDTPTTIRLVLNYADAFHRYPPKVSKDGDNWEILDSTKVQLAADSVNAFIQLELTQDTVWVAAQELQTSKDVEKWCKEKAALAGVQFSSIGKSKQGRALPLLDISQGVLDKKEVIILLSRQHPPEVTGYLAMRAFVEEILADTPLSNQFRKKYRILVFPLMNPDGVDLGHWRHNAGGIDLNRDWAYYHQPEILNVANYIAKTVKQHKSKVLLGIDFHSTWYDILYTNKQSADNLPQFKDYWIAGLKYMLRGEKIVERPSEVGRPVSKSWFLTQFDAEGITYEVGDDTPRDLIDIKGRAAAIEMMGLLVFK